MVIELVIIFGYDECLEFPPVVEQCWSSNGIDRKGRLGVSKLVPLIHKGFLSEQVAEKESRKDVGIEPTS